MAEPLRALVLAGGLGLRLRSVVGELPKSLAPVAGRPFLHYVLAFLRRNDVEDVTLCTGYGASAVSSLVGTGEAWGLRVDYSEEPSPLGTGGAVRLAVAKGDDERLLVLNGDSYFDVSLGDLVETHRALGGQATIAARRTEAAGRFGTLTIGSKGDVLSFQEKAEAGPAEMNGGIYVLERSVLDGWPADTSVSLERQIFPSLISADAVAEGVQAV
ncbi:MAG: sugar phosphate nucleotidyltransferase [Candidatus Limnocylindrales bacterium]